MVATHSRRAFLAGAATMTAAVLTPALPLALRSGATTTRRPEPDPEPTAPEVFLYDTGFRGRFLWFPIELKPFFDWLEQAPEAVQRIVRAHIELGERLQARSVVRAVREDRPITLLGDADFANVDRVVDRYARFVAREPGARDTVRAWDASVGLSAWLARCPEPPEASCKLGGA